jgi:hypothetical protein
LINGINLGLIREEDRRKVHEGLQGRRRVGCLIRLKRRDGREREGHRGRFSSGKGLLVFERKVIQIRQDSK